MGSAVRPSNPVRQHTAGPELVYEARGKAKPGILKIALVTSFPPSRGDLNEYGYHLARSLRENPRVALTILADETSLPELEEDFDVKRCWRFDSLTNPLRLLRAIRACNPDVVWFNIGFSTFARDPVAAFLGITIPALTRLTGFYTHVTLHTVFERINLKDAGIAWPRLYRIAGRMATRLVLQASDVSVLLPSFRKELIDSYGLLPGQVHYHPHGTFEVHTADRGVPQEASSPMILAFGYWGTYKRLDVLLDSIPAVADQVSGAHVVVAGMNHPSTPGYLDSLQHRWRGDSRVRFVGYVPEQELIALFRRASVLVLPYTSAAGTSGVVHQACEYGLPMIAAAIPELRELASEEGIAIEFYTPGDREGLTRQLVRMLRSSDLRRYYREHNSLVAQRMQMPEVTAQYLSLFEARLRRP
jgi:glycosyltransferase involved in cell wall biosynthesis